IRHRFEVGGAAAPYRQCGPPSNTASLTRCRVRRPAASHAASHRSRVDVGPRAAPLGIILHGTLYLLCTLYCLPRRWDASMSENSAAGRSFCRTDRSGRRSRSSEERPMASAQRIEIKIAIALGSALFLLLGGAASAEDV